jgi:hypothetical protein
VGSVGVRAYVALLEGSSEEDVVFLHLKQLAGRCWGAMCNVNRHGTRTSGSGWWSTSSRRDGERLLGGPRWTTCRVGRENEDVAGRIECVDISMGRVYGMQPVVCAEGRPERGSNQGFGGLEVGTLRSSASTIDTSSTDR